MQEPDFVIPRAMWGAAPSKRTPVKVKWRPGGKLWLHHTTGNRVVPAEPGMPGPRWLRVLLTPARYPADLVRKVRLQKRLADAARLKTTQAEAAAMRAIQAFHQKTRGWNDIGYGYVCFDSGRVYEGRGWEVLAAHCPGHNDEPSLALAGDWSSETPPAPMQRSARLMAQAVEARDIDGHRDGYPTSCPGDGAYQALCV